MKLREFDSLAHASNKSIFATEIIRNISREQNFANVLIENKRNSKFSTQQNQFWIFFPPHNYMFQVNSRNIGKDKKYLQTQQFRH